jgi:quercetin dioxygenase-like cupin family protein
MQSFKHVLPFLTFAFISVASAQETFTRTELRRTDLSGAPGMEVVLSLTELKPGDKIPLHFHHGIETGYILEGGMIQVPGQAPSELVTGASVLNLRDMLHAGYTVIGDKTIKLLTVHIVDKGQPLYDESSPSEVSKE